MRVVMRTSPGPRPEVKGVLGRVEAAAREVVAERLGDLALEERLPSRIELSFERRQLRSRGDRVEERREAVAQPREGAPEEVHRRAGVVLLEGDLVGVARAVDGLGAAQAQVEQLAQDGRELREVGLALGLEPRGEALALGARQTIDELGRHAALAREVAPEVAPAGHLHGVGLGLELGEPPADPIVGDGLVHEPREERLLLAPQRRALGRHHGLLVPAERAHDALERLDPTHVRDERAPAVHPGQIGTSPEHASIGAGRRASTRTPRFTPAAL
ncbi:MAG: hypothetical protein M5U28_44700 [Sandaracinaceae bacterium]|nr:hypothetical protein [Sandaracinaceae bacterium]